MARLQPPTNDPPMADGGQQHSQAWAQYNQNVADRLADVASDIDALTAGQGVGVTDGSNAAAGHVGEYITAAFAATAMPNITASNVGSISLPAGDWDVWGWVLFNPSTQGLTTAQAWISTVSASAADPGRMTIILVGGTVLAGGTRLPAGPVRLSVAATTTVYLGTYLANAAAGSTSAGGHICARRRR